MNRLLLAAFLFCTVAASEERITAETKVVVLGIAQDGGIPHLGCEQEICRTQHHSVSSVAILHGESVYLIDATPDLREQHRELIRRFPKVSKKNVADGIFLTHAHMGHYSGLLFLGKESISTRLTPVYCSSEMADYLNSNEPWKLLRANENIELKTFESRKPLDFGFRITPISVPHRKEFTDTHGFLIEGDKHSLLYIPDIDSWEPVKSDLEDWLKRVNYALLDGTFYSGKELPGRDMTKVPHPTIENSMALLKTFGEFKAKIYFTHLNHTNLVLSQDSTEQRILREAGYHIAVDWQEFSL